MNYLHLHDSEEEKSSIEPLGGKHPASAYPHQDKDLFQCSIPITFIL